MSELGPTLEVARRCIRDDDARSNDVRHAIEGAIEAVLDLEYARPDLPNVVRLPIGN